MVHLKYAVEVAQCRSINKAAESLYVGQPALSRAIKDLEDDLGITIFERSAKGMDLTHDGEVFINYAKGIIEQVSDLEEMFRAGAVEKKRFSISVPRASYISEAFTRFSLSLDRSSHIEIFYKETNSQRALKNILQKDYKLGIIRYAKTFEKYYAALVREKELRSELVTEFRYVLIFNKDSELAKIPDISFSDLKPYIEIAHADPYVPSLPFAKVKREELPDNTARRIFVFERCSQFELLANNKETFMWVSPVPQSTLDRYGLVQRVCTENKKVYSDVLVYGENYKLTELDNLFIEKLFETKKEIFP